MHLTSHIIAHMAMPPFIAHYRSNWFDQRFRKHLFWMKLNPPNAHRLQIKICEKRQTRNVQFRFMQNAFRILKPIQKSSKCVWVFRNTGANAFAKNQTRLANEDKRDLYWKFAFGQIIKRIGVNNDHIWLPRGQSKNWYCTMFQLDNFNLTSLQLLSTFNVNWGW